MKKETQKEERARLDAQHRDMVTRVGSISISFARVEVELNNVIRLLMKSGDPAVAEITTDQLSFSQTVDLFRRLANHVLAGVELQGRVTPLQDALKKAGSERNQVIHSCPYTDPSTPGSVTFEKVRKKRLKPGTAVSEQYTPSRLQKVAEYIWWTHSELQDFGWKLSMKQTVEQPSPGDSSKAANGLTGTSDS